MDRPFAVGTRTFLTVARDRNGPWIACGLIALLLLPSCGLLPSSHYALATLPLSAEQGWVQLPTRRWLLNPGISPDAMLFCPAETCGEQVFIARLELTGREIGFAEQLMRNPVRTLAAVRSTQSRRDRQSVSRADVTPLTVAGWMGGSVSLETRIVPGKVTHAKAAQVAVVAKRDGDRAWLMMSVASTSDVALSRLKLALE